MCKKAPAIVSGFFLGGQRQIKAQGASSALTRLQNPSTHDFYPLPLA